MTMELEILVRGALAAGLGQYWLAVGSTLLAVAVIALLSGGFVPDAGRRSRADE